MRCVWCHNPEGLSPKAELYQKTGCTDCGLCRRPCAHEDCAPFGRCVHICPKNLLRVAGREWDSDAFARELLKKSDIYELTGGGVSHVFRIPLVAGITDTEENLQGLSGIIGDDEAELLSYNILAPAKYKCVGREFSALVNGDRPVNAALSLFKNATLRK